MSSIFRPHQIGPKFGVRSIQRFVSSPRYCLFCLGWLLASSLAGLVVEASADRLQIEHIWTYRAPEGTCEIPCFDSAEARLFITNGKAVDIVDARRGKRLGSLAARRGYQPTSVAVEGGRVAVAWAPNRFL